MSAKSTLLIVLIALVLGAYVLFVESPRSRSHVRSGSSSQIFRELPPLAVRAVEVRLPTGSVRAERLGDGWQLRTPRSGGQQTGIEALLEFIAGMTNLAYLPPEAAGSTTNAANGFGFTPPRAVVRLEIGTNRIEFKVGARTLLRNGVYLQKNEDPGVFVTDEKLLDYLPKSPDEWRDPRVVAIAREEFDGFVLTTGLRTLALRLEPARQVWRMDRPVNGARVDQLEVERLLFRIEQLQAQRFVSDDPKADIESFGLNEPSAELRFLKGTNLVRQVFFSKTGPPDSDQVYARSSLYSNIVSLPAQGIELLRVNPNDLRDRKLLDFDPAQVAFIELKSRTESFALRRATNSGIWQYSGSSVGVDSPLVTTFLYRLAGLTVAVWESDAVSSFSPYGLDRPDLRYVLYGASTNQSNLTNVVLASVDFSTNNVTARRPDLVYARRTTNESSVFGMNFRDVEALPRNSFQVRDRQIWQFSVTNILTARVIFGGRTNLLRRSPTGSWVSDEVRNVAIEEAFFRLGNLRADEWVAQGEDLFRSLFPPPRNEILIEVNSGGTTILQQMAIGSFDLNGRPYAAIVSGEGTRLIFSLSASLWSDWITRLLP